MSLTKRNIEIKINNYGSCWKRKKKKKKLERESGVKEIKRRKCCSRSAETQSLFTESSQKCQLTIVFLLLPPSHATTILNMPSKSLLFFNFKTCFVLQWQSGNLQGEEGTEGGMLELLRQKSEGVK